MEKPNIKDVKSDVLRRLRDLKLGNDTEQNHSEADTILCEFLSYLGHEDVVAEFDQIKKWYA